MKNTELELIPETLTALTVFKDNSAEKLVNLIKEKARNEASLFDINTAAGKAGIRSLAAKVAKSKTFLDGLGKDMVADWKEKSKLVDNDRKLIRDELDALRDEVRKPLTDLENAEKERLESIEYRISQIFSLKPEFNTVVSLKEALTNLEALNTFNFMEKTNIAIEVYSNKKKNLLIDLETAEKYELQQQELERLRKQEDERLKVEHEHRIAQEAAQKAKLEAEQAAQAIIKAEREKFMAAEALRVKQIEDEKLKAERAAQEAALRNLQELEIERQRISNQEHRDKIAELIKLAFVENGIEPDVAVVVFDLIDNSKIPNVKIVY